MLRRFLFAFILLSNSYHAVADALNTVYLRDPSGSEVGESIKVMLDKAYKELGLKTEYIQISSSSELAMASKGRIDGVIARHSGIEDHYPHLVRVPVPILTFKLMQVGNVSQCGSCQDDAIKSVGYSKNVVVARKQADSLPQKVNQLAVSYDDPNKLLSLLTQKRVDSIYLMDFQIPRDLDQSLYILREVKEEVDYHYLTPKLAHLSKPLSEILVNIVNSQKEYRVDSAIADE